MRVLPWIVSMLFSLLSATEAAAERSPQSVNASARRRAHARMAARARVPARRPLRPGRAHVLSNRSRPTLYPGVAEALEQIEASGIAIGVATNNTDNRTRVTNQRLGVAGRFTEVLAARDSSGAIVRRPKPDPEMLLELSRRLGIPTSEMAYVGDSDSDVVAAQRAGMISIALGTPNGTSTREELDAVHPDVFVADGFAGLPRALAELAANGRVVRAVGIDMDGTYVDAWPEYREAVRAAARDVGIELSRAQLDIALERRAFSTRHPNVDHLIPARRQQAFLKAFYARYVESGELDLASSVETDER